MDAILSKCSCYDNTPLSPKGGARPVYVYGTVYLSAHKSCFLYKDDLLHWPLCVFCTLWLETMKIDGAGKDK